MVLNDNPRISRATQMRVQRLIDRMGYQPNRLAQSLSGKYTCVLAVLLPALRHAFADAYFGELISGICDRAGKLGYKVMLEQAKPDFIKERRHIEIFERRYVDGVLCLGMNDWHHFLADFAGGQYPAMIVDNYFDQWNLDYAACDYRCGAEQVMNYLLQLGHREDRHCSTRPRRFTPHATSATSTRASERAGVEPQGAWIEDGKFTEDGGARRPHSILDSKPGHHRDLRLQRQDGDRRAALPQPARASNVPAGCSVVGFDDLQHAAFVTPTLTTVHLPLYQVGSLACERLIERIRGRSRAGGGNAVDAPDRSRIDGDGEGLKMDHESTRFTDLHE